jgi:hypothetical protein
MGRHLVDSTNGAVHFDWPGVRLSFQVQGTTFVSIRIQTAGSVFGYRVYPVTEQGDKLEQTLSPKKHQQQQQSPSDMLLGGGLFGDGNKVKEYALAVGLDPFLNYKIDIWKRDDPTGSVCIIEGIFVDKEHGVGVLLDVEEKINENKIDTLSPLYAALQAQSVNNNTFKKKKKKALNLEFVGNSDTVGFGNLTTKSSLLYFALCQASCIPLFRRLYEGTDVTQSWPAFLSRTLDNANYSVVAWSGVGAKYSMSMNESMTMLYPRVLASEARTQVDLDLYSNAMDNKTDDYSSSPNNNKNNVGLGPADAVLVYIGHNDEVRLANHRASNTKMSSGYEELLLLIRQYRPAPIPIIVVVPTLNAAVTGVASEAKRLETCAIQHEVWSHLVLYKLGGPAAGYYLVENSHTPAIEMNSPQDFGMNLHWNVESQRKWANGLAPQIRQVIDDAATGSAVAAAPGARHKNHHVNHNNNINNNHDTFDNDDHIHDDVSSKKANSVLVATTANPMIAGCVLPFSCFAE